MATRSQHKTPTATGNSAAAKSLRTPRTALFLLAISTVALYLTLTIGLTYVGVRGAIGPILFDESVSRGMWKFYLALTFTGLGLAGIAITILLAKHDLPEGVYVSEEEAPTLWRGVKQICDAVGERCPDRIVLTPDINAFAADIPEKGALRRKTRVLSLGYPLLGVLSLEQSAAVIAHEIGHFNGRDTAAGNFHFVVESIAANIRPDEISLNLIDLSMLALSYPAGLYLRLANILGARASQADEFAADRCAGHLLGAKNAAEALVVLATAGQEFETEIWKPLTKAMREGGEMPASFMATVNGDLQAPDVRARLEKRLAHALMETTGRFDSHPCLADRLNALGVKPALPSFEQVATGARGLLWKQNDAIRARLDAFIRDQIGANFEARQAEIRQSGDLIERVYPRIDEARNPAEAAEIVSLILERSVDFSKSREMHEDLVRRFGAIPSSASEIAFDLIEKKDLRGAEMALDVLERKPSMAGRPTDFFTPLANCDGRLPFEFAWLQEWFETPGTRERIEQAIEKQDRNTAEFRSRCETGFELVSHGLEPWHEEMVIENVREYFKAFDLVHLWLARSREPQADGTPIFVLLIEASTIDAERLSAHNPSSRLNSRIFLPGLLQHPLETAYGIGENKFLKTVRDYPGARIWSIRDRVRRAA